MLRILAPKICRQTCNINRYLQHNSYVDLPKTARYTVFGNYNLARTTSSKSDNKHWEQVYHGVLTPQIRNVKIFSLTSSVAGLLAQPIIIKQANELGSTSLLVALCSVVGFFTFVTPLLLHLITKKYVTEMHYNPETSTYKAITMNFFLIKKSVEFKTDEVEVPEIPGMFTTMKVNGKPLFIEARHFNDPLHYAKIMGYDKPMDFKLGDTDKNQGSD